MLISNFFNQLYTENSMPPTLYSFMESIVNYENPNPVKIKDLAKASRSKIFDFDYPISEAFNKEKFEELFLKHYMFRRINYDTLLAFKLHLEIKLNEIMPKYNKMIEGFESLVFDGTIETHARTTSDSRTSSGSNTITATTQDSSNSKTKYSETPENAMSEVSSGTYVSEFTDVDNTSNGSSNSSSTSTNNDNSNIKENITIKRGDPIEEYQKYLEVSSSIYEMIFKECDSLFYGLL